MTVMTAAGRDDDDHDVRNLAKLETHQPVAGIGSPLPSVSSYHCGHGRSRGNVGE